MTSFIEAEKKDISLIQDLARKSWNVAYSQILSQDQIDYMLSEMYSENELLKHFDNPNYHYFLVEHDNEIVGFIGYEISYQEDTTKLHRIYLIPESQGKGLGKKTIDFLKEKIAKTSNKRIILNVNKENNAKNVYESQGFTVHDEIVLDIGNGFVMDDYIMEYKI